MRWGTAASVAVGSRRVVAARAIADGLTARHVRLSLGGSVYDPHHAVGRLLFNVLAMVAVFESDNQTEPGAEEPPRGRSRAAVTRAGRMDHGHQLCRDQQREPKDRLDHDHPLNGRPFPFGDLWKRSADDVAATVSSDGGCGKVPVTLALALVEYLDLGDHVGWHADHDAAAAVNLTTAPGPA